MEAPWVRDEMKGLDLKDRRLNRRLIEVLLLLGAHPTASIPGACGGYAEMTAAYRLFDNDKVGFDDILRPHTEATRARMAGQETVILPQDTTELDLTRPQQQVTGAGPLDDGGRRGVLLHLLHAFTPDGTPLGTVQAKGWSRPDRGPLPKPPWSERRKRTPIQDKESYRWIEGLAQAGAEAQLAPRTHFISVADSEADIYELMVQAQGRPDNLDWIIRACQNRALMGNDAPQTPWLPPDGAGFGSLREQILQQEVLFTQTLEIRGRDAKLGCDDRGRRQPRRARRAKVDVRATTVTLRPPWRPGSKLPPVTVNVVLVKEVHPPADDVPVEWMLLTSLPITTARQVHDVIRCYCVRWMIEILFRTLKSGCKVEGRRFEHVERFWPCLAIYLIVAWRTLYVCRRARAAPGISCEAVFEPGEWKAVCVVMHGQPPPASPPTLSQMVAMVAQLGGYVNRKRPDEPGPQTVWLGLQRLHDMALCWHLFGPEAKKEPELV
jgi:hypothetical protein